MEWGVGPGGEVPHRGCCPAGKSPARHIPEGMLPGPVRSQGRVTRCVIQNWPHVLSAPRRARTLQGARGRGRTPVVSYVGYSLKESWGEPWVVMGTTLTRQSTLPGSSTGTNAHSAVPPQQAQLPQAQLPQSPSGADQPPVNA